MICWFEKNLLRHLYLQPKETPDYKKICFGILGPIAIYPTETENRAFLNLIELCLVSKKYFFAHIKNVSFFGFVSCPKSYPTVTRPVLKSLLSRLSSSVNVTCLTNILNFNILVAISVTLKISTHFLLKTIQLRYPVLILIKYTLIKV